MSKIKEFENIPDIDIEGEETLEEAVADCKALFGKYNKELFNGEVSLERCSEARLVLLTLAHRSHHNMEYSTACLKAELLPTSTGPNLDNLAPLVGVEYNVRRHFAMSCTSFCFSLSPDSSTTVLLKSIICTPLWSGSPCTASKARVLSPNPSCRLFQ